MPIFYLYQEIQVFDPFYVFNIFLNLVLIQFQFHFHNTQAQGYFLHQRQLKKFKET